MVVEHSPSARPNDEAGCPLTLSPTSTVDDGQGDAMFDIGTLDTIIAMVIVLLVLSLVVQSIQSLIKKVLKLKSGIVFDSMEDLFKYIDTEKLVGKTPQQLVDEVTKEFEKLGRVSLILKNPTLESLDKDALQKILERLCGDKLKPEIENWFDTVKQGFEERYTRHMKSIAMVIAFLVVVFFNANFFNLYRSFAGSDALRAAILAKGPDILKQAEAARKAAESAQPKSSPKTSPSQTPNPPTPNAETSPATGSTVTNQPSPNPTSTQTETAAAVDKGNQELAEELNQLRGLVDQSKGLGLNPLTPKQVSDFVWGQGNWAKAKPEERFVHGVKVLLGWTIMALLLSVGAPFWQDTLESLFGIKNLIRQKSDTKDEDDKGGQH
jgi:hypothetical protein